MCRSQRIVAALLAAFALVFAQLAVSAHTCDFAARQSAAEMAPGHECCQDADPGANSAGGNVCVEHCQYGTASVDNVQPVPAAIVAAGPALRVEVATAIAGSTAIASWRLAPKATPPPPAILFGVLRI